MTKVFFSKDYTHNAAELTSTLYRAGNEYDVEDDVAELAVIRGFAIFSTFAEDDLFDIAEEDEDEAE